MPLDACLAKTRRTPEGFVLPGRTVLSHCLIVGAVSRALIARLPAWLSRDLFPRGVELIAAAHDIGKVSPTFQKKIHSALSQQDELLLDPLKPYPAEGENKLWGGHAGVSQVTMSALGAGPFIPEILGQHHGYAPNLGLYSAVSEVFGGLAWHTKRTELFSILKETLQASLPKIDRAHQALAVSGLTSVADWIGSGSWFDDPSENWQDKIEEAVDDAGFITPTLKQGLGFTEIFGFEPRLIQQELFESIEGPGVYVLEAPMGSGKTEASLFAAYNLLQRGLATGIYFALPTQLTSDKIHERFQVFLKKILHQDSLHRSSMLLHGNARLRQLEIGEDAAPGGSWFRQGKRGILAPFAVGTVDQALMAVLNVKHGFVRTFGLMGKVVILDEVHSYDTFTGTIIDSLIELLREIKCTVIVLSATLTKQRRRALSSSNIESENYPLITSVPINGVTQEISVASLEETSVVVRHAPDTAALGEAINRAMEGQQILWIENTVNEAQEIFRTLSARATEMDIACGLLHSRFTKSHRAQREEEWVSLFGKSGHATRAARGRILVGTQVLEQSLDIDSDFLVTRMAPTDMLLQRLGRLWRHADTPRPQAAEREMWILSPNLEEAVHNPIREFGSSSRVYAPYVLCRSLEVWNNLGQVSLPTQIRSLLEATYADRPESEEMFALRSQVEEHRAHLRQLALRGLSCGGTTRLDDDAQTRYSAQDSTDVLLLRSYYLTPNKKEMSVTLLDGTEFRIPVNGRRLSPSKRKDISALLSENIVTVAEHIAPMPLLRAEVEWLGDYLFIGTPEFEEAVPLRIGTVDSGDLVRCHNRSEANTRYHTTYNQRLGYCAVKRDR